MAFEKGISGNPAGKPIGAKNKIGEQLREMISDFLIENFDAIQQDFKELPPKDRAKLYCDLLQYGLPKLQTMQLEVEQTAYQIVSFYPQVIGTQYKIAQSESEIEI